MELVIGNLIVTVKVQVAISARKEGQNHAERIYHEMEAERHFDAMKDEALRKALLLGFRQF